MIGYSYFAQEKNLNLLSYADFNDILKTFTNIDFKIIKIIKRDKIALKLLAVGFVPWSALHTDTHQCFGSMAGPQQAAKVD